MLSQIIVFAIICAILLIAAFLSGRTRREKRNHVVIALVVEALMFLMIFTNITEHFARLITF